MLAGDAVDSSQTETGAAPLLLRREKRLENPLQRIAVHAGTAVSEREGHTVHRADLIKNISRQQAGRNHFCRNRKLASTRHGMLRIDGKVHHDLLDLPDVPLNCNHALGQCFLDCDILRQGSTQEGQEPPDDGIEIQHPEIKRLTAAESKQLADQVACTDPCAVDGPDILQSFIVRAELPVQNLGISENRRQKIIEVMGHAAGKPADGFHFLRLEQILPKP
nr:hypothetical protein [Pelodictyon luteolum]